MTERLLALATRHGNVLSTAMATGIDLDRHALEDLCRDGTLRRLRRAAYVLGSAWDAATPEGRLALRTRAVMADRPDWVVTHASALALHGLPLFGVSLDIVDVQGPVQRTRVRSGVRVHPRHPEGASRAWSRSTRPCTAGASSRTLLKRSTFSTPHRAHGHER